LVGVTVGEVRLPLDIPSLDGYISSPYGPRTLNGKPDDHKGLDLVGPLNGPVYSIQDGTVSYVDSAGLSSAGKWLWVEHEGFRTRYLHLGSIIAKRGQRVLAGQMIGTMGATGHVTGPHLHLDVIIDGQREDPEPYLRGLELLPNVATVFLGGTLLFHGKLSAGATLVAGRPIREIAEVMNCDVEWVAKHRRVVLHPRPAKAIEQAIELLKTVV